MSRGPLLETVKRKAALRGGLGREAACGVPLGPLSAGSPSAPALCPLEPARDPLLCSGATELAAPPAPGLGTFGRAAGARFTEMANIRAARRLRKTMRPCGRCSEELTRKTTGAAGQSEGPKPQSAPCWTTGGVSKRPQGKPYLSIENYKRQ